jgi:hypothetical protein
MKQINFTNLKLLISFFMVCWSFPALSADSYNSNTGVLSIARVAVGDTVYSDVKITIGEVVSIGTLTDDSYDTYDSKTNRLTIPVVSAYGNKYYNVVVSVGSVLSIGAECSGVVNCTSFKFTYNLHDSLPSSWTKEFAIVMNNTTELMPIYSRTCYENMSIYAWVESAGFPYSVNGIVNPGASFSGNGKASWIQLPIPDNEFKSNATHLYSVIVHERYHVYQRSKLGDCLYGSTNQNRFNTKWLLEGTATALEELYAQQYYFINGLKNRSRYVDFASLKTPEIFESYSSQDKDINYASSTFMILVLAKELQKSGFTEEQAFKLIFKDFFFRTPDSSNWKSIFSEVFKVTVESFYEIVKTYPPSFNAVLPSESLKLQNIFKK